MKASPEKMKGEEKKKKALDILAGSDDESDSPAEDNSKIQINEEYARRFEHNKRREALQRLEEQKKKGVVSESDDDDESDDEDESSDEDVSAASRRIDRHMLQVISRIRSGDSAILDKHAKVYSSEDEDEDEAGAEGEGKAKKERLLYLKDVNAQHLLEEGPEFAAQTVRGSKYDRIAYDERQREGLKEFLEAEKKALGDGDGDDDDLFIEKQTDGDDGDSEEDEDEKKTEQLLGEVFGKDEELDENEKFLKDYILNRPYLESGVDNNFSLDDIQEEEAEIEKWEQHELDHCTRDYNFRHEEMAASEAPVTDRVMGHPRLIEGSVRKKERSRKKQRKSKEEEQRGAECTSQAGAEELKHLKNLKMKEIAEKLEKIRTIAGIEGDAACKLGADDLEEDFDPEDYDRKMREMFDEKFKYRQVQPNSYGLKTWEILQSNDRDLNQYVPIKKLAPYREDEWQVTHHKKMNKASILGGQKIEGKKVKSHKKSKSEEGPCSEEPRTDKLTGEQEETYAKTKSEDKKVKTSKRSRSKEAPSSEEPKKDKQTSEEEGAHAKEKSTRSKRRNRKRKELHISKERQELYGKIEPKRHKSY
uniref:Uncharacterized protein n=1 Tax=Avena sativa TaxID=4498 RepID=A0ACD5VZJ9_AVESA